MQQTQLLLRDDVDVLGAWPGTMGGLIKKIHKSQTKGRSTFGAKLVNPNNTSFVHNIGKNKQWSQFGKWFNDVTASLGVTEPQPGFTAVDASSAQVRSEFDISLLPSRENSGASIFRAFEATTRSDELTNKRTIKNPPVEMNCDGGVHVAYRCPDCDYQHQTNVELDVIVHNARRENNGVCRFRAQGCPKCKIEGETEYIVTSGSRAVVNWYKLIITIDNDLDRIRSFVERSTGEVDGWIEHEEGRFEVINGATKFFVGNVSTKYLSEKLIDDVVKGLHWQYKYSMFGIIISVSDAATPIQIPSTMKGFDNPVNHWVKKRHIMSDLWWNKIRAMLKDAPECDEGCVICGRYNGEDWHDVAPHIGHCDVFGRLHAGCDMYSLSWVERMMVTASYWDELGNKNETEVSKARCSIGRACTDVVLGRDHDFDQRIAKLRCLLNMNTYTMRRCLSESRYLADTGLGSFCVGKYDQLQQMLRGRLFEGMTLPYVEDDLARRCCSDCVDMVVLAGQLGIVFHDAIDLPNDTFNGEYMNAYRMAASGGYESLLRFTRGCYTLLRVMATTGTRDLCCGHILHTAIGNSVSWYFYCGRYNYASNVQLVYSSEYTWKTETDVEAACWVGQLLGCNKKTLERVRGWEHLDLMPHEEWGCGNSNPVRRFKHMYNAAVKGIICDLDSAEEEGAEIFCALSSRGRQHIVGTRGKCLCCEVGYECVEMNVLGDMVGRFVHHALRVGTGKIQMVIDN